MATMATMGTAGKRGMGNMSRREKFVLLSVGNYDAALQRGAHRFRAITHI